MGGGKVLPLRETTPRPSSWWPSSSSSITDTEIGSHQFKINGFTQSKGLGIGKYIASDTFMVGGHSWAIYFYPDGKNADDDGKFVSLFIALVASEAEAETTTDVRALFELTLLDQSGNERHKMHTHFRKTPEVLPYTLKRCGSMWGYKRYYRRTALETSDYLKDDCISVHCRVGVVRSHTEGPDPKVYSIAVPPSVSSVLEDHPGLVPEKEERTLLKNDTNELLPPVALSAGDDFNADEARVKKDGSEEEWLLL